LRAASNDVGNTAKYESGIGAVLKNILSLNIRSVSEVYVGKARENETLNNLRIIRLNPSISGIHWGEFRKVLAIHREMTSDN
jgi:hypothetical protein